MDLPTPRTSTKRILHVMSSLEPSGMEMMLLCSAGVWASHDIACDVVSTAPTLGSVASRLDSAGYRTIHLPFRSQFRHLPNLNFLGRFYRLCKTGKYDAIHIHTEAAPALYAILAKAAGIPTLALTVHNTFHFHGALRFRKTLERRLVRFLGGRYGMVSAAVERCEQEVFGNAGACIRNWIDVEQFRPPTNDERLAARKHLGIAPGIQVLVTVGNCNVAKNHGELIQALGLLARPEEILYLHVGREQDGLPERQLAEHLSVSASIRFCGSQEAIRTYLWASDLFIMPSLHEGLAIAPLEAIASGCTVILSRVPGLVDLEPLTNNACFVQPTAQSLASEIDRLLALPSDVRRMRCDDDSARVRSHFSPNEGIEIICEALYKER